MEVKTEAADQSTDSTTISIMKIYKEMSEKYGKLQQEFVELRKENTEIKREMAKLKKEMVRNDQKYERQNVTVNEKLAKLERQNRKELEQQQSQKSTMENSHSKKMDDYPNEEGQNEFAETMMMINELNQREQQNLDNNFDFLQNAEIRANCSLQMQQTTSSTLNVEHMDKLNGLREFIVEKIEWSESGDPSFEMDLDREENGISKNLENDNIDGQIKCALQIGNIFKCNWPAGCEYQAKELSNMQMHWYTHTGKRPYVCEECGQSFAHPGTLKRHTKRIHNGEKPYRCDLRGQSFATSRTLQSHTFIHKGEMPYQCDVCGKSFGQSGGLASHKRIHTGEKPYQCEMCGQFLQSSILNELKRTHVCMKNGRKSTRNVQEHSSI